MYITIKSLWERHKNKSLIARLTGHDWKTVAQKIKEIEAGKEYPKKKPHPRILDYHKEHGINRVRLHNFTKCKTKIEEENVKL